MLSIQPQLPGLGSRAKSLYDTGENAMKSGAKAAADLAQGKVAGAAMNGAATALALANLGLLGGLAGKLGKSAEKVGTRVENSLLNSTTITKLMTTTAKELESEFNMDLYKVNVLKAAFGQDTVKKTGKENELPDLPPLPELPQLQTMN